MGVPVLVRGLRLAVAALGVAALITALLQSTGSVANFFSYFTVESNLLAVVLLAGGAVLTPARAAGRTSAARSRSTSPSPASCTRCCCPMWTCS